MSDKTTSASMNENLEKSREEKTKKGLLSGAGKHWDSNGDGKFTGKDVLNALTHPLDSAVNATKTVGTIVKNASDKVTGGRASENLEALDRATTPTTEETQKAAAESLANKHPEKLDYDTSINENKAKESIENWKNEVKESTNRQVSNLDQAGKNIDAMDESTAAQNASDLANEITNHDITTEEGRKGIQQYLDTYEEMLSDKYDNWTSNYNRALMFSALSQGLSQAFGIGNGIDFTQHPDVTSAKEQLDDFRRILSDEKATAGKLSQQKLDQAISDRDKRSQHQQEIEKVKANTKNEAENKMLEESQKLVDGDIDASNSDKAMKAIAEVQLANNQATLKQGLENAQERIEEGKIQKAGAESLANGVGYEGAKAVGSTAKKTVEEFLPSLIGGK